MSENGEIYTAGKNFTLPPALTALTNSNSDRTKGKWQVLLSRTWLRTSFDKALWHSVKLQRAQKARGEDFFCAKNESHLVRICGEMQG